MGEETDDFKVFTWPLKDYRRMDKKALSPEFSCGGHKWYAPLSFLARLRGLVEVAGSRRGR